MSVVKPCGLWCCSWSRRRRVLAEEFSLTRETLRGLRLGGSMVEPEPAAVRKVPGEGGAGPGCDTSQEGTAAAGAGTVQLHTESSRGSTLVPAMLDLVVRDGVAVTRVPAWGWCAIPSTGDE